MMKNETVTRDDIVQRTADTYCVPLDAVLLVERKECNAGIATYVMTTTKGIGWSGCGQQCSVCKYQAAEGVVGDDAIETFMEEWLDLFFAGETIPSYVAQCLVSDTFPQHYRVVTSHD